MDDQRPWFLLIKKSICINWKSTDNDEEMKLKK